MTTTTPQAGHSDERADDADGARAAVVTRTAVSPAVGVAQTVVCRGAGGRWPVAREFAGAPVPVPVPVYALLTPLRRPAGEPAAAEPSLPGRAAASAPPEPFSSARRRRKAMR
jgi:hypothetical protein